MNKFLKISFLLLLLAIPVGLVLFLRFFGENQFDIPVYYEGGVADEISDCRLKEGNFTVPDSLVAPKGVTLVIFFQHNAAFGAMELNNQVRRLRELFGKEMSDVIVYSSEQVTLKDGVVRNNGQEQLEKIMVCGFITKDYNQYVLVDKKKQIRGYYGVELDEVDRLIVEMKILFENGGS